MNGLIISCPRWSYYVEPITNRVVEMDARTLLRSIPPAALAYSQEDLHAQTEEILALAIPDFPSRRQHLTYKEFEKENLFFFDWRAAIIPGLMNRPFVHVRIHETGLVFAYYNTLGFD